MVIRQAKLEDVDEISKLASKNTDLLGFVMKVVLKERIKNRELLIVDDNGIKGFVNYHLTKKGYITIYEICVSEEVRGKGYGKELFQTVQKKAPIKLKVIKDNPANEFYIKLGGKISYTEKGRKRPLNIYLFDKI